MSELCLPIAELLIEATPEVMLFERIFLSFPLFLANCRLRRQQQQMN